MRTANKNESSRSWLLICLAGAISVLLVQNLAVTARRKHAEILQEQVAVEVKKHAELRARLQSLREKSERTQPSREKKEGKGDYWLPGELDRFRNRGFLLDGSA